MAERTEPTGTIATEGIELFTLGTPNGYKVSILLEELREAYGDKAPRVTYQTIDISKGTQKEAWFTKINPNGRIPAITDKWTDGKDIRIFESGAILQYLTERYDKDHKVSYPRDTPEYWEMTSWVCFFFR